MLRLLLPMKTLNEEWKEFSKRIYPSGMIPDQARQLETAFMAGATVALCLTEEASGNLQEDAAEAYLRSLFAEAHAFISRRAAERYLKGERPSRSSVQ